MRVVNELRKRAAKKNQQILWATIETIFIIFAALELIIVKIVFFFSSYVLRLSIFLF